MTDKHHELIQCPECGQLQGATVEHTVPWWTYVHECIGCKFIIMESEWVKVK